MIKRMQKKFIILTMSAFLLVLAVIITSINLINYNSVITEADELLNILSEEKGGPQDRDFPLDKLPPGMSPEAPFESRYFSAVLDKENGNVVFVETSKIFTVDSSKAMEFAKEAYNKAKSHGFIDAYRYVIKDDGMRNLRITFLDCGRKLDAFNRFLVISIAISLLGFIIVFLFIAFFSNKIIRPISESYEKQKRFITDAGHELKTPLTIISADTDILIMEYGENEWLHDIQHQTKRLADLTGDLIYLSRMEENSDSIEMIPFSLSDVICETAQSFTAPATTKNITILQSVEPLLTFCGNEKAVKQLVSVLLDNAVKYCPDGGEVAVTLSSNSKNYVFSVSNSIQNKIQQDDLYQFFDRFYRVDTSRNTSTGGFGIGLSVAKAIVSAHNGKISASSSDNELTISVLLPN
ncbi:MAG: HAMP domain-containing histidine kinase [Oscillospiraceae bacterium]|nr:HAMP domain-containing histidine kinase [Oscillospiraceae bacterium]